MVENNKVLLENGDTLKNVVDPLTKFANAESSLGIENQWALPPLVVDFMNVSHSKPCFKEYNKWENVGHVLYSL